MTPNGETFSKLFEAIQNGATLTDVIPDAEPQLIEAYGVMRWMHIRQFRKAEGNPPYARHPLQVCMLVRLAGGSLEQQIAALLHDVVEDGIESWSGVIEGEMFDAIKRQFGIKVASLVLNLTDVPGVKREYKEVRQISQMSVCVETRLIKASDKICNAYDTKLGAPAEWTPEKVARKRNGGVKVVEIFPDLPQVMHEAAFLAAA